MKFQCLHCNQHYEIDDRYAGCSLHCRICKKIMKVPIPLGKSVTLDPNVLTIPPEEIRKLVLRRRHFRFLRRCIFVCMAILLGAVCGAVSVIMLNTHPL